MKPMKTLIRTAIMGAVFYGSVAAAEEISEDALIIDYANCMQGCLDVAGQTSCEILCGCSMSRFRAELDQEAYDILSQQMNNNKVDQANRAFLDQTAEMCVAEMDAIMGKPLEMPEEEGLPVPEDKITVDEGGE